MCGVMRVICGEQTQLREEIVAVTAKALTDAGLLWKELWARTGKRFCCECTWSSPSITDCALAASAAACEPTAAVWLRKLSLARSAALRLLDAEATDAISSREIPALPDILAVVDLGSETLRLVGNHCSPRFQFPSVRETQLADCLSLWPQVSVYAFENSEHLRSSPHTDLGWRGASGYMPRTRATPGRRLSETELTDSEW